MMNWFLNWLDRKGRKSVILDRDGLKPYLIRYYLAYPDHDQRQRKDIPFNIFLHQFMLSDEPVMHDHPWSYFTIILKGGYYEHTPSGTFWRGPGHMRWNRGGYHWIECPEPGKTWTLFFRGRTKQSWGFLVDKRWVHWQRYLEDMRKKS